MREPVGSPGVLHVLFQEALPSDSPFNLPCATWIGLLQTTINPEALHSALPEHLTQTYMAGEISSRGTPSPKRCKWKNAGNAYISAGTSESVAWPDCRRNLLLCGLDGSALRVHLQVYSIDWSRRR